MMHRGHVRPPSRDIPPAATCCEAKFTPEIWDLGGSSVIESNPLRALLSFDFFVAFGLPCAHALLRLYAARRTGIQIGFEPVIVKLLQRLLCNFLRVGQLLESLLAIWRQQLFFPFQFRD